MTSETSLTQSFPEIPKILIPTHWTYEPIDENEFFLRQGDIIMLPDKDSTEKFFGEKHIFAQPIYSAFIVTTQDCDLVIRPEGHWDADYINLAGIVPISSVLSDLLDFSGNKILPYVYTKKTKEHAKSLLKRIFNQNAWKIGLFYIHPDDAIKIGEPSVALLRVTSTLHLTKNTYEKLQKFRVGRLSGIFRAKLGWTVGNLYSRVGTPDWGDINAEDKEITKTEIDKLLSSEEYVWVDKQNIDAARKAGVELDQIEKENIESTISQYKPLSYHLQVSNRVASLIKKYFPSIEVEDVDNFKKILYADPTFKAIRKKG